MKYLLSYIMETIVLVNVNANYDTRIFFIRMKIVFWLSLVNTLKILSS